MRKDMGIGPGRILMAPELDGTFYEIGQKVWIFGGAWSSPYLKIITEVLDHQYAHPVKKHLSTRCLPHLERSCCNNRNCPVFPCAGEIIDHFQGHVSVSHIYSFISKNEKKMHF